MKNTSVTSLGAAVGAAHRHYNLGGDDTTLMPITDATGTAMESGEMVGSLERSYFTILFYDVDGVRAEPTAGSVQIQGRAGDTSYWQDIANGTFNGVDVNDAARTQPAASGPMRYFRVLLTSITGVTQFSTYVDKY